MKRPHTWSRTLLLIVLVFFLVEYVTFTWVIPHYVIQAIQAAAGGELVVDRVQFSFPLTTILTGLRFIHNTPDAALSIQRAVITPHWLSLPSRTLWIDTLQIERPMLRLTRTKSGTLRWPDMSDLVAAGSGFSHAMVPARMEGLVSTLWQIRVNTLKITEGVLELIDEQPSTPFHGLIDHASAVIGPLTDPPGNFPASFAVSGQLIGEQGHAAPLYCSGWFGINQHNVEASCQMEPLALAAFGAYYQSSLRKRVDQMTLKSTSQWIAKTNQLEARIQLELGNIRAGDLAFRGRGLMDAGASSEGDERRLRGEMTLTGPLDDPAHWHAAFTPGDTKLQQLVARLLERGIEVVPIPLGGQRIKVSISATSEAMMRGIETISEQIRDALDVLVPPPVEPPAPAVAAPVASPSEVPVTVVPETSSLTPSLAPEVSAQSTVAPSSPVERHSSEVLPTTTQEPGKSQ